jgi:hypothetical protein
VVSSPVARPMHQIETTLGPEAVRAMGHAAGRMAVNLQLPVPAQQQARPRQYLVPVITRWHTGELVHRNLVPRGSSMAQGTPMRGYRYRAVGNGMIEVLG